MFNNYIKHVVVSDLVHLSVFVSITWIGTVRRYLHLLINYFSCGLQYDKETAVEAKFTELEKQSCNINPLEPSAICTLKNNTDLLACKAEYYHQCGEYQKCFELTSM